MNNGLWDLKIRLIQPIGAGSFGEVWRAEVQGEAPTWVEVAIKCSFQPVESEEVQHEIYVLQNIRMFSHPHLLSLRGYGESMGRLWISMDLAEGSLWDRLRQCRKAGQHFPVNELRSYISEAAQALDYLHSFQVIHGGIKPDDILLLDGHAKVADLDLTHRVPGKLPVVVRNSATICCMAPEMKQGESSIHSDQYALACTYVWLRLERLIFSPGKLLPELDLLPKHEQNVLVTALAQDPNHRFSSCQEFAKALLEE